MSKLRSMIKHQVLSNARLYLIKRENNQYQRWLRNFILPSDIISNEYKNSINEYWGRFGVSISGEWHKFYASRTGMEDVRFIDDAIFYSRFLPILNRQDMSKAYADKNFLDLNFADIHRPRTIMRNINGFFIDKDGRYYSRQEAVKKCMEDERIIIKSALDSCGGRNIDIINFADYSSLYEYKEMINKSFDSHQENFIVQEVITQHPELEKLNKTTLNTIRVTSLLWEGEVYILNPFFRVGTSEVNVVGVDSDVFYYGINNDGRLKDFGFDYKYRQIDMTNIMSKEIIVPNFSKVIEMVKMLHKRCPYIKFIGSDISIDKNGDPILIEINARKPFIIAAQCTGGPLFGDMTEVITRRILSDKQKLMNSIMIRVNGLQW